MSSNIGSYNLRSKKRFNGQNCYLEQRLINEAYLSLNPKVCLKRVKLLENSENNRFYVKQGKIFSFNPVSRKSSHTWSFKYTFILFLVFVLFLIYKRDNIYDYNHLIMKIKIAFKNNNFPATKSMLNKENFKIDGNLNLGKNGDSPNEYASCEMETISDKVIDTSELKKILKNVIREMKKGNKFNQTPSTNFIEQQCQRESSHNGDFDLNGNNFFSWVSFSQFNHTDYALESRGAKIISVFDTEPYGVLTIKFWEYDFGAIHNFLNKYINLKRASSVLVPWKEPGDCWAFKGTEGRVEIQLSQKIIVTGVTYDHITEELSRSGNINSAPKKFIITGIEEIANSQRRIYLGTFEYAVPGPSIQTFSVKPKVGNPFNKVELMIKSNHGNPNYTCVYKIRIHGYR